MEILRILVVTTFSLCGFVMSSFPGYTNSTTWNTISDDSEYTGSRLGSFPNYIYNGFDFPTQEKRRLGIPKGTKLTVSTKISVPTITHKDPDAADVEANISVEFPLTVTFNDISLGVLRDGILMKRRSLGLSRHSRKIRDTSPLKKWSLRKPIQEKSVEFRCHTKSLTDRRMILQKLEMVLGTALGLSKARSCLLRIICELHEIKPFVTSGFGLLGEFLMDAISVKKLLEGCKQNFPQKFFTPFAEAEAVGKAGTCDIFAKQCEHSLLM